MENEIDRDHVRCADCMHCCHANVISTDDERKGYDCVCSMDNGLLTPQDVVRPRICLMFNGFEEALTALEKEDRFVESLDSTQYDHYIGNRDNAYWEGEADGMSSAVKATFGILAYRNSEKAFRLLMELFGLMTGGMLEGIKGDSELEMIWEDASKRAMPIINRRGYGKE